MSDAILELRRVGRVFRQGAREVTALCDASLRLVRGETVALVGPSGAGKSTLLYIAGLLERADTGDVTVEGIDCNGLGDRDRTLIRRRKLGFIYQFHHLLPEFSAVENVVIPQLVGGVDRTTARQRAHELLEHLGLAERLDHRPARLSGGEQQRVAFARALANHPAILLADEPTGNLDPETARSVMDRLITEVRERHLTALVATHNVEHARRLDRTVRLVGGALT